MSGTMDAFDINCRRAEFNAEYDRLTMLLNSGLITPDQYINDTKNLRKEYADVMPCAASK